MGIVCLHDRDELEPFLRREVYLHLYELGDLDEFFWPHTIWFGLRGGSGLSEVALLYTAGSSPVLLALTKAPEAMRSLLLGVRPLLPPTYYAHLSEGLIEVLAPPSKVQDHGVHLRMGLMRPDLIRAVEPSTTTPLSEKDLDDLLRLYQESYPGNFFDPRMLASGQYFGVRREGRLVGVAGVHVFSPRYGVAALGNITVHPDWRGRGLGSLVTAGCCRSLLTQVRDIGLNVKADNRGAITCYERLGFEPVASYGEFTVGPP